MNAYCHKISLENLPKQRHSGEKEPQWNDLKCRRCKHWKAEKTELKLRDYFFLNRGASFASFLVQLKALMGDQKACTNKGKNRLNRLDEFHTCTLALESVDLTLGFWTVLMFKCDYLNPILWKPCIEISNVVALTIIYQKEWLVTGEMNKSILTPWCE